LGGRFVSVLDRAPEWNVPEIDARGADLSLALHSGKNLTERSRTSSRSDSPAHVEDGHVVGYADEAPFASSNHFPYTKTTS
jgi:hypothetical protein